MPVNVEIMCTSGKRVFCSEFNFLPLGIHEECRLLIKNLALMPRWTCSSCKVQTRETRASLAIHFFNVQTCFFFVCACFDVCPGTASSLCGGARGMKPARLASRYLCGPPVWLLPESGLRCPSSPSLTSPRDSGGGRRPAAPHCKPLPLTWT